MIKVRRVRCEIDRSNDYIYLYFRTSRDYSKDLFTLSAPIDCDVIMNVDVEDGLLLYGIEILGAMSSLPKDLQANLDELNDAHLDLVLEGYDSDCDLSTVRVRSLRFSDGDPFDSCVLRSGESELEAECCWDIDRRLVELKPLGPLEMSLVE